MSQQAHAGSTPLRCCLWPCTSLCSVSVSLVTWALLPGRLLAKRSEARAPAHQVGTSPRHVARPMQARLWLLCQELRFEHDEVACMISSLLPLQHAAATMLNLCRPLLRLIRMMSADKLLCQISLQERVARNEEALQALRLAGKTVGPVNEVDTCPCPSGCTKYGSLSCYRKSQSSTGLGVLFCKR